MKIKIQNCSSPGASFTKNTNQVILSIYEWLEENPNLEISFKDFRMKIEHDKHVNDNNNRNIYPLLKNYGFINYSKGLTINTDGFFTKTGLAYVKTLQMIDLIEKSDNPKNIKLDALQKASVIISDILYDGLYNLLSKDVSYKEVLLDFSRFLINFGKINKIEFALMLYAKNTYNSDMFVEIKPIIEQYRKNTLNIDVDVTVRNDLEIREKTNSSKRDEGLGFLSSYNYFTGLFYQASLIQKDKDYYVLNPTRIDKLRKFLEVNYE